MASLVVHGEMADGQAEPLSRLVYVLPIMQPDPLSDPRNRIEHVPDEVFFEDRIARAVRRMFEGEGAVPAQAPSVCVINLSIGDPARPFIHTPSPWARLLDWLSWKYRVLFCVSAGNYPDAIDIALSRTDYLALTDPKGRACARAFRPSCLGGASCPRQNPSMPSRSAQPTLTAAEPTTRGSGQICCPARRCSAPPHGLGMDSAAQSSRKSCSRRSAVVSHAGAGQPNRLSTGWRACSAGATSRLG